MLEAGSGPCLVLVGGQINIKVGTSSTTFDETPFTFLWETFFRTVRARAATMFRSHITKVTIVSSHGMNKIKCIYYRAHELISNTRILPTLKHVHVFNPCIIQLQTKHSILCNQVPFAHSEPQLENIIYYFIYSSHRCFSKPYLTIHSRQTSLC